ncbi:hypothetical protein CK507_10340 [Pseudomonas sp. WN033]|nr:hypothetical protein CK507_10340 [Pseudomonas sp. WN033]
MSKTLLAAIVLGTLAGCASNAHNSHLNQAYQAYDRGDCAQTIFQLSRAERASRSRPHLQPEISLLRGLCLERQALYVDAAQTYRYLLRHYPNSEYSYRAGARLETLRQLGHYQPDQRLPPERP